MLALITVLYLFLLMPALAFAEIGPQVYPKQGGTGWTDIVNGIVRDYPGFDTGVHPQGTWNDPATLGVDAFNFNDPQDYKEPITKQIKDDKGNVLLTVAVGPHGNYLTSTHKCRECHAVHRTSGIFKLTRSDTRFESCDWCHGSGGGSGYNVQTDNDDMYGKEFDTGHTMGYGVGNGKWKAPDDTYPAFTPGYWMGGFTCFDCHSPHANPQRLLGFSNDGTKTYPIYNLGHDNLTSALNPGVEAKYPAGSWLLLKDPDRELDPATGSEVSDNDTSRQISFNGRRYPVNKQSIDWDKPSGLSGGARGSMSDGFHLSEFCVDCHDGNAGLSTEKAPVFSEDRALRTDSELSGYELGAGHDSNQRQAMHYFFDPEDGRNNGPECRTCHRASSDCSICHSSSADLRGIAKWPREAAVSASGTTAAPPAEFSSNQPSVTLLNVDDLHYTPQFKHERTVAYPNSWRTSAAVNVCSACFNDGFNWPHKTLSWKMLKDNLFGVDFDGVTPLSPGQSRSVPPGAPPEFASMIYNSGVLGPLHDIDSVCLDCHNPTIWNPQLKNELILKGLP